MTDNGTTNPEPPRRRGRPPKATGLASDLILPVALTQFAQAGFEATNLRQIAAAARIDVALISHRFGSKLGLWRAVVDFLAERFLCELSSRRCGTNGQSADSQSLRHSLEQLVDLVCDQPAAAMFLVREAGQQADRFEYFYERLIRPVHDIILPPARPANAEPGRAGQDEDVLFFTVTGAIAITVVMRAVIARFSTAARNDESFRQEIKKALLGSKL